MKKLLLFDQTGNDGDVYTCFEEWQLQRVVSISQVLNHFFWNRSVKNPDLFVILGESPASEVCLLLRYLRKHCPGIPFVLIVNRKYMEGWRTLLKGIDIALPEQTSLNGFLDQFNRQLS